MFPVYITTCKNTTNGYCLDTRKAGVRCFLKVKHEMYSYLQFFCFVTDGGTPLQSFLKSAAGFSGFTIPVRFQDFVAFGADIPRLLRISPVILVPELLSYLLVVGLSLNDLYNLKVTLNRLHSFASSLIISEV